MNARFQTTLSTRSAFGLMKKNLVHAKLRSSSFSQKDLSCSYGQRERNISDELCKEYGLSVISNPERGTGKSHYEWEQNKAGNSWKNKLKISIDECIKTATSFDDFLEKMKALDYEIK